MTQMIKSLPAMQQTQIPSLSPEDPLEKEMATHSSSLAWKNPRMEKPGKLQSKGSHRIGNDGATNTFTFIVTYISHNCIISLP